MVVPHAHNTLVHYVTEVGLIGSIGVLVLGVALARRLVDGLKVAEIAPISSATAAGLLGFLAASLVDHTLNLGGVSLPLAIAVAWIDGRLIALRSTASGWPRLPRALAWCLTVPVALGVVAATVIVIRSDYTLVAATEP